MNQINLCVPPLVGAILSGLDSLVEPIFPISVLQLITTLVWQSGLAPSLEIARFRVRFSETPPRKDSFRGVTERKALLSFFTHSPRGKEPVETQAVFQERYRGRTKVGVVSNFLAFFGCCRAFLVFVLVSGGA